MAITYIDQPSSKIEYVNQPKIGPDIPYAERLEPGIYGQTSPFGQRLLENAAVAAGGYGVGNLVGTSLVKAAKSKLGRALLNSPEDIGQEMRAGLEKAGVARRPPELASSAKFENPYQYPSSLSNPRGGKFVRGKPEIPAESLPTSVPIKYPEDPATLYNFADKRLNAFASNPENVQITPTELNDYKTILSNKLTAMKRQGLSDTPLFSDLADLNSRVSDIHASVIPGRADQNAIYGLSKGIREIPGKVYSVAKKTGKLAALGAVGGLLYKLLQQ